MPAIGPVGVAVDGNGTVYAADWNTSNSANTAAARAMIRDSFCCDIMESPYRYSGIEISVPATATARSQFALRQYTFAVF